MKKNLIFISCDEAKHICDKNQYKEATLLEKIKLSLRLSWCHITRAYSKQNNKLTKTINDSKVDTLNPDEKEKLQRVFDKELTNHQ